MTNYKLVVDQFLRRLRDQLRPLARAAFEKQQALAEDEAIEQERLRVGFLMGHAGCAIQMRDVLQSRGIDAGHRGGGSFIRPGPLPDRQLDRHACGIHALGIQPDHGREPVARGRAIEAGLLFDRRDPPRAPGAQDALEQRGAILEAPVEAALGDAEVFRQHLDADAVDAASGHLGKARLDPDVAFRIRIHPVTCC